MRVAGALALSLTFGVLAYVFWAPGRSVDHGASRKCIVKSAKHLCNSRSTTPKCWRIMLSNQKILTWSSSSPPSFRKLLSLRPYTTVHCKLSTPADPDALWLHAYNSGEEMLVLLKIGSLSFIMFVAAVLCDGALFEPRRVGIAGASFFVLVLVALSALLQLLLIPPKRQIPLLGAGFLASLLYIALVIAGAVALPALVLLLQSFALLYINFLVFFVQTSFWTLLGILHFLGVLFLYHAANLRLQLQTLYGITSAREHENGNDQDSGAVPTEEQTGLRQLRYAHTFASLLVNNPLLSQVANAFNDAARATMQSNLPQHLFSRLTEMEEDARNTPSENESEHGDDNRSVPGTVDSIEQHVQIAVTSTTGGNANTNAIATESNERTPLLAGLD